MAFNIEMGLTCHLTDVVEPRGDNAFVHQIDGDTLFVLEARAPSIHGDGEVQGVVGGFST